MRALAVVAVLAAVAVPSGGATENAAGPPGSTAAERSAAVRKAVSPRRLAAHLRALQRIADRHGGNRAAGTRGYAASAEYVHARLARAGYSVRYQRFPFTLYREHVEEARQLAPTRRELAPETLDYSPSTRPGGIRAQVAVVRGLGCEPDDLAGDYRGKIALVRRGQCTFAVKAKRAADAGAAATIVYNSAPGSFDGTLGGPDNASVPTVGISGRLGEALLADAARGSVVVYLNVRSATRKATSRNVIAELPSARGKRVIMAGGHLDSVASGPGINDNGSGVAALLEIALQLRRFDRAHRVRFAFWGAEEVGLVGSRHYVDGLRARGRASVHAYLNFDMIGSPGKRGVYAAASATRATRATARRIEKVFRDYFAARRLAATSADVGGASDHAPFAAAGIATGGLFTGHDRCYHRGCDRYANVNLRVLDQMADAAAHALVVLAPRRER